MMTNNLIFVKWRFVVLAVAVIAAGLAGPAYCQMGGTVLLLQQTPPQGGTVTPDAGVYRFELDEEVTLTAVPKPGYQFVYWLGDVSDSMANTTIVYLDAPKIVIAVFERASFELLPVEIEPKSMPGGGLRRSTADYARRGGGGGGGWRPRKWRWPEWPEEEEEDFPAPEEGNDFPTPPQDQDEDFPVPIPEPATGILLAVGMLALMRKQGAKNRRNRYKCIGKNSS